MDCRSKHVDIEFIQGLEWNFLQKAEAQRKRILLGLDDLFDEAEQSKDFLALVVAGRHRNVHLLILRLNLFQRTNNSKTIDLIVTQIILFNSPSDSEQIGFSGRQLGERHATVEAYKRATQKPFGHLMIDLDVSSKSLRYSSNCSGDVPSIFYCSTDQLCLHLHNEFTKLLYSWFVYWFSCYTEKMFHLELLRWNNQFFLWLYLQRCKRKYQIVKGEKVQAKIAVLSREKSIIEALCSRRNFSMKRKPHLLASPRGLRLLKTILPSVFNHLKSCHDIKR